MMNWSHWTVFCLLTVTGLRLLVLVWFESVITMGSSWVGELNWRYRTLKTFFGYIVQGKRSVPLLTYVRIYLVLQWAGQLRIAVEAVHIFVSVIRWNLMLLDSRTVLPLLICSLLFVNDIKFWPPCTAFSIFLIFSLKTNPDLGEHTWEVSFLPFFIFLSLYCPYLNIHVFHVAGLHAGLKRPYFGM